MLSTTLFAAINAASTVICNGFEIDSFDFDSHPDLLRLDCGEDPIAMFQDGPVQIDTDGECHVASYAGPEAESAGLGEGLSVLSFRVSVPLSGMHFHAWGEEQDQVICERAASGVRVKLRDGRQGVVVAADAAAGVVTLAPDGEATPASVAPIDVVEFVPV